jgi:hypothetical protein
LIVIAVARDLIADFSGNVAGPAMADFGRIEIRAGPGNAVDRND